MAQERRIAAYEVEAVGGGVRRETRKLNKESGEMEITTTEVPAGYMVYLPKGNSFRVKGGDEGKRELRRLGMKVPADLVKVVVDKEATEKLGVKAAKELAELEAARKSEGKSKLVSGKVIDEALDGEVIEGAEAIPGQVKKAVNNRTRTKAEVNRNNKEEEV